MSAHRLLILSVIRRNIEYESEVWEGNKIQVFACSLEAQYWILGCSCNEVVR